MVEHGPPQAETTGGIKGLEQALATLVQHFGRALGEIGVSGDLTVLARIEQGDSVYMLVRGPGRARHLLTEHQRRIVRLIAQGKSNREVAQALGIQRSTVASHLGKIFRKLEVDSRAALAMHYLSIVL